MACVEQGAAPGIRTGGGVSGLGWNTRVKEVLGTSRGLHVRFRSPQHPKAAREEPSCLWGLQVQLQSMPRKVTSPWRQVGACAGSDSMNGVSRMTGQSWDLKHIRARAIWDMGIDRFARHTLQGPFGPWRVCVCGLWIMRRSRSRGHQARTLGFKSLVSELPI